MKAKKVFKQFIEVVQIEDNVITVHTTSGKTYEFRYADGAAAEKAYKSLTQKSALEID